MQKYEPNVKVTVLGSMFENSLLMCRSVLNILWTDYFHYRPQRIIIILPSHILNYTTNFLNALKPIQFQAAVITDLKNVFEAPGVVPAHSIVVALLPPNTLALQL